MQFLLIFKCFACVLSFHDIFTTVYFSLVCMHEHLFMIYLLEINYRYNVK